MRFSFFFLPALLFIFNTTNAQTENNTSISGKVFDKSTNQPLEYATISLVNNKSGKVVNGAMADALGAFQIKDIPAGNYKVLIEYIGYASTAEDNIVINSTGSTRSLGTIFLAPSAHNLQDVTIVGQKAIVENKLDKVVYNAANDITSQGGLAIDVLKKVPQVTVDLDGNVELQGNSNILFLINGKPSSVFGSSLSDALASIPASQIKSIEAITNPGAKYDSQGTGGIINIILQDNQSHGFNGNINLSAGTRLENGSANFNLRHNNFGFNAYFGGHAQLNSKLPFSQSRTSTDTAQKTINSLMQSGNSNFERNGFRSGIGFDWNLTKNDDVVASIGYNQFINHSLSLTNQEQLLQDYYTNPQSDIFSVANSDNQFRIYSIDWSLDYKKKFSRDGQELEILYSSSNGTPNSKYTQTQTYFDELMPFMGSQSENPGKDKETSFSVDYSHPVNDNFLIETGIKATIQGINSNAEVGVFSPVNNQFINDPLQSYNMKYLMDIYAGYLSFNFKLFNFLDVKSGVRYEFTKVKIDYPNTSIPSYGTIVPTIVFSHNLDKNTSLKLAYSKRIERPEYRELNPFVNLSDPYNFYTGNLLLKPEIGNNFELGYNTTFQKGGNLYIALIERINTHDKKRITNFYPEYLIGDSVYSNVSVSTEQNIGEEYNSGISFSGSFPITSRLNLRSNLMLTTRYLVTTVSPGNQSTGIRARLNSNASYELPKDLVLELFGMYSSPARNIQGKIPQFFIYTFAFRKLFLNKKASIGFIATNPFNKYIRQETTVSNFNYNSYNIRQLPLRSFGISLTYKFGKLEFNKKKDENDTNSPFQDSNQN